MKIQWIGHSCFRLMESTGTTILTDPYKGITAPTSTFPADAVTISNSGENHSNLKLVHGKPQIFDQIGVHDFNGVQITGISVDTPNEGLPHLKHNIIYKFRMDGLDICHLGDINTPITPEIMEELLPCNVLLIPVGGNMTIDAEQAKDYVDALMPDFVIPMHYRSKNIAADLEKVDVFLRLFDEKDIVYIDSHTVELDRDDQDEKHTTIYILDRFRGS